MGKQPVQLLGEGGVRALEGLGRFYNDDDDDDNDYANWGIKN